MIDQKSLLVAQREYVENLRTKMFWIGIFFFPVIVILSIVVPAWLERTKDIRRYAVIDRSGWLLAEVERRAAMPDLEKVFREALTAHKKGKEDRFERFPDAVRAVVLQVAGGKQEIARKMGGSLPPDIAELDEDEFERRILHASAQAIAMIDSPDFERARRMGLLPEEAVAEIVRRRDAIKAWYDALPPKEARRFGSSLAKGRYQRVEVDGEGDALIERLNRMVAEERLFAYFVIGPDPVEGNEGFKYVSKNLTDESLLSWFRRVATDVVRDRRLEQENIDREVAAWIQKPVDFEMKKVGVGGKEEEVAKEDMVRQWAPVGFVYLLWMAVFSISQMLLTNTIEEKSNRILEVLLSSVSPLQLMTGKILGILVTGLTMILSWVVSFVLLVRYVPDLLGIETKIDFGLIARDPLLITSFVVYFMLGYLFFSALLVGIGSVCNTIKEANNLMMPVTVMLMLPLFAMIPISKDPNGRLAVFLSYVPPFTPFVMMNRAAGPPTPFQYAVTTLLLLVSIVFVFWAAAKVFRIGILLTGKPPTPLEILRWIRAPVGQVPVREEDAAT